MYENCGVSTGIFEVLNVLDEATMTIFGASKSFLSRIFVPPSPVSWVAYSMEKVNLCPS